MKRKEEIQEASKSYGIANPITEIDEYGNFNERDIETPAIDFEEGAEWADNSLIKKAETFFRTTHYLNKLDNTELENFIKEFNKIIE